MSARVSQLFHNSEGSKGQQLSMGRWVGGFGSLEGFEGIPNLSKREGHKQIRTFNVVLFGSFVLEIYILTHTYVHIERDSSKLLNVSLCFCSFTATAIATTIAIDFVIAIAFAGWN